MDFTLTETQADLQALAAEFAEKVVAPRAHQIDERNEWFPDVIREAGQAGFLGMEMDEELGGIGADTASLMLTTIEIARRSASVANVVSAIRLHIKLLRRFGTPEQQQRWLPTLISGEEIGGFAITEPGAGSDVSSVRTRAVRDGDGWRLDGNKAFITLAPVSDMMVVLAVTEPEKKSRGMTCFIVEKGTPGLSVGKQEKLIGQRGVPLAEVSFDGVWVPAANQFGAYNEGFKVMMAGLDSTRLEVAALALGISRAALEESSRYAASREQFGQPIGQFQGVGFMLAEMATEYEAGLLLTLKAAKMKDDGVPFTKEASMAKYYTTDNAMRHAVNAVQIFGGYGCSQEYPVERLMRDIKPAQIYDGTSQVHRMIIARKLLSEYGGL